MPVPDTVRAEGADTCCRRHPDRIARSYRMSGMQLAGAALGGLLGGAVGLRATLVLGGVGLAAGCLLLLASPVRTVRDLSDRAAGAEARGGRPPGAPPPSPFRALSPVARPRATAQ